MKKGGRFMENEKEKFTNWLKEHKKELVIASICVTAIIETKRHQTFEGYWISFRKLSDKAAASITEQPIRVTEVASLKNMVKTNNVTYKRVPHDVAEHYRNLPNGQKASQKKIAIAAERGYNLMPGQTLVEAYRTGGHVA